MIMIDRSEAETQGKKLIPFPDVKNNYEPMFYLEDGKDLELTLADGEKIVRTCTYLGTHHFNFGSNCYHIDQFAELHAQAGNTYRPMEQVTDLSVFRKLYADRDLKGEDGKRIPYRAILGWDPDWSGRPQCYLCVCPEAQPDRRVALVYSGHPKENTFYSIPEAWSTLLPIALPETRHELNLVSAIFEANNNLVEHITQKEWDAIPADYKGVYEDFYGYGDHPDWKGRRTAFLPGHGTALFIEGVSFVIDKGKSLDQQISGAKSRTERKQNHGKEYEPIR